MFLTYLEVSLYAHVRVVPCIVAIGQLTRTYSSVVMESVWKVHDIVHVYNIFIVHIVMVQWSTVCQMFVLM